jgi:(p)ppGpp synthase/HD superfamily hydrolase
MAKTKNEAPPKSKAETVREAIDTLVSQKREVATAAVLALLQSQGIKNVKPMDIYQSDAWKELRDKEKAASATPEPKKAAAAPQPDNGGITKTEAVKQALAKLGQDAKPSAVIEHVKKAHGLDVSAQTVSNLKALQAKKPAVMAKRRGRPPKTPASTPARTVSIRSTAGVSLEDIRAVKELADRIGAEKVAQLAEVLA